MPVLVSCLVAFFVAVPLFAATPNWERVNEETGPFVMSLARDTHGNLWIGTEDKGVFRWNPSADEALQWTQFTTRDGLGDDNGYAIACDKLGGPGSGPSGMG